MFRYSVLSLSLLLALTALGRSQPAPASPSSGQPDHLIEFHLMAQEIQSINLVNGLYLSGEQARQLAGLARQAADSRGSLDQRLGTQGPEVEALLAQMKAELVKDGRISPGTRERHDRLMTGVEGSLAEHRTRMADLTRQARSVLNESQLELVARYQPCLIPPDPSAEGRSGQSGGGEIERHLQEVRNLPGWMYPIVKQKALGELRTKLVAFHGPEEAERRLKTVEEAMEQARSLSDEEFALRKIELARSIDPGHEARCEADTDQMIGDHLLGRGALAALEHLAVAGR